MNDNNYRICTRCVMDISDPSIRFNPEGVCNHCLDYAQAFSTHTFFGVNQSEPLDVVIERIKADGRAKQYDCIIGLSGGVDSSYVAYLVRRLGLRPLAVHVDNGWNSELAVANIENICRRLEIDLQTDVLNWPEFRDLQLSFLRAGTPDAEIPSDHAIVAVMYRLGRARNVPVIAGYNARTESHMPAAWSQGHYDKRYILSVHRRFGTVPLKTFPTMGWLEAQRFTRRRINILNLVPYRKVDAIDLLKRELGWRSYGGKHSESTYTKFFQVYYLPRRFGYDKRRSHLSSLINAGEISRSEALTQLKSPPCSEQEGKEILTYVLKKLQLTVDEYRAIETAPLRSFEEYDSYLKLQHSHVGSVARFIYRRTLKRWL